MSNDDVAGVCRGERRHRHCRSPASIRRGAPDSDPRSAASRRRRDCVRGLKLHPPLQQFFPNDRIAYPLYEVFAEARLPVLFHTGHSGIGTGMPGGGGIRLKYGHPMPIDDVAVDFPEMPIIMAHPSFPWQDEAISVCLHKPTVYIDLSGWSPKYFSPTLVQYANTLLKHKGALRIGLSLDHTRALDVGLRENRDQGRGAAARSSSRTRRGCFGL